MFWCPFVPFVIREETYEDREGLSHLKTALEGAEAMIDLNGNDIFEDKVRNTTFSLSSPKDHSRP